MCSVEKPLLAGVSVPLVELPATATAITNASGVVLEALTLVDVPAVVVTVSAEASSAPDVAMPENSLMRP